MRFPVALLLVAMFAVPVMGENLEMFSPATLDAVARSVLADQEIVPAGSPRSSRPYWVTYAWLTAATIYDVETTFYLMERCSTCDEQNPITKPIIEKGRAATYLFSFAINGIVMYVSRQLFDRYDTSWRIVPLAMTIAHAVAGTWNLYEGAHGKN